MSIRITELTADLLNRLETYDGQQFKALYPADLILRIVFDDDLNISHLVILKQFNCEEFLKNFDTGLEEALLNLWAEVKLQGSGYDEAQKELSRDYEVVKQKVFCSRGFADFVYLETDWVRYHDVDDPSAYLLVPEFINPTDELVG